MKTCLLTSNLKLCRGQHKHNIVFTFGSQGKAKLVENSFRIGNTEQQKQSKEQNGTVCGLPITYCYLWVVTFLQERNFLFISYLCMQNILYVQSWCDIVVCCRPVLWGMANVRSVYIALYYGGQELDHLIKERFSLQLQRKVESLWAKHCLA